MIDTTDDRVRRYATQNQVWRIAEYIAGALLTRPLPDANASEVDVPMVAAAAADVARELIDRRSRGANEIPQPAAPSVAEQTQSMSDSEVGRYPKQFVAGLLNEWTRTVLTVRPPDTLLWTTTYFDMCASRDAIARFPDTVQASDDQAASGAVGAASPSRQQQPSASSRAGAQVSNPNPVVLILFYSAYGHVLALAKQAVEGAKTMDGATVLLRRVPETLPHAVVEKMAVDCTSHASIPEVSAAEIRGADGIMWGFPTRFGAVPAQVCTLIDSTGQLWAAGALAGKPSCLIISSATQHGGQEMTAMHFSRVLLHHGMVFFGPTPKQLQTLGVGAIQGCSPYCVSTVAGPMGDRNPTQEELAIAFSMGRRLANMASRLGARR